MMLTTACAPVDNDPTAAVTSHDAKIANSLAVQTAMSPTLLDTIHDQNVTNFDAVLEATSQTPETNLGRYISADAQTDGVNSQLAPVDERFHELEGDHGATTTDPEAVDQPENQNVGDGECMALGFGGDTSGRIVDSKDMNLDYAKGATIEGWIRIDNKTGTIVSKQSGAREAFWSVGYDDGQLLFTVASDASHQSVYAAAFPAGEWFHFAIIRGETIDGGAEVYIDGVDGTEQLEDGADEVNVVNPHPVVIGQSVNGDSGNFNGSLASLHIARGVWHSADFVAETELEAVETTLGLWDFTQVELGMVQNAENDDYTIRLRGPIYTEHTPVCD
jgi:hypothetical protein